jgi:diketogulonate reductase-like aldo/keto reductase
LEAEAKRHLEENMAAEKLQLRPDEWKKIEELVRS